MGQGQDSEQNASRGLVGTSAICFLPFGKVVGVRGGPVPQGVGDLASPNCICFPTRMSVRPVLSKAKVAQGALRIEIRDGSRKGSALGGTNGRLAALNVTVIISVPQGRVRDEDRQALLRV
ncbi:hypothetical protein [Streptomyces sp. 1222.5]|uniref:hypothetical protein n=1 Tax=Streptomyces sp. 1222.5 TaxID=1881026 RepID=UPI003EBF6C0A